MKWRENKFFWLTIFGIAMGFLEAAVVVYLRKLYYPGGFEFPLLWLSADILSIEWLREVSTIVMLIAIAYLAGKNKWERFSYFLFSFAVWDIAYYLGWKAFLDWPSSLLTWDALFLIPIPWAGPVLAPVICSAIMIVMAILIVRLQQKNRKFNIKIKEWLLLLAGSLFILYTFLYDYGKLIIANGFLPNFFELAADEEFKEIVLQYVPAYYNWSLFVVGMLLIITAVILLCIRNKK